MSSILAFGKNEYKESFLSDKQKKKLEKNRQKEMEEEGTKGNSSMRQKRVWRKSLGKMKIIRFISFVRSLARRCIWFFFSPRDTVIGFLDRGLLHELHI